MNLILDNARIEALFINRVGNATLDQGYDADTVATALTDKQEGALRTYFFKPFEKGGAMCQFHHEADLRHNTLHGYVQRIFADPGTALASTNPIIAEHLYAAGEGKLWIKQGYLSVVYLADCIVDDEMCDAVGIFKSESRDPFLNFGPESPENPESGIGIAVQEGFAFGKLDKGAIIFNTAAGDGYRMAVVCRGKQHRAYWMDHFLHVRAARDTSYLTAQMLRMAKEFSQDTFAPEHKIASAEFLNRVGQYFEEKEAFDAREFAETVLDGEDESAQKRLLRYHDNFLSKIDAQGQDTFAIDPKSVKKQRKNLQKTIRLDSGVLVTLTGGGQDLTEVMERAFDETSGRFYYKLYFMEEN
jgi:hypothetical protein